MTPNTQSHTAHHCPLGVAFFEGRPVCYLFDDTLVCPWPVSSEDRLAFTLQPGRLVVRELGRETPMVLTAGLLQAIAADLTHQASKGKPVTLPNLDGNTFGPVPTATDARA